MLTWSWRTRISPRIRDVERGATREHLVENDGCRIEVAPSVEGGLEDLFRAHVRAGPRGGEVRVGPVARQLGDAEVAQLHDAVPAHEHVRRLHVAVHEAERVRARERSEELLEVVPRAREREPGQPRQESSPGQARAGDVAGDHLLEVVAVDVLHRDRELARAIHERMEVNDVRMGERAHGLRFVEEERAKLRPCAGAWGEDLQRDGERRVGAVRCPGGVEEPGSPDDPHPPLADPRVDDDPHVPKVDRRSLHDRDRFGTRPLERAALRTDSSVALVSRDLGATLPAAGRAAGRGR